MNLEETLEQIKQEISHTEEQELLTKGLSGRVIDILCANKAFIAGGAITSVFCNKKINDYDVFFRDEQSFLAVKNDFHKFRNSYVETNNACTYKDLGYTGTTIQLIKLPSSFKPKPEDIFNEFDFTICCGLFDFAEMKLTLHRDFLKHLAQRKLVFNETHKFPISSFLRTKKFQERGFELDNYNLFKILLKIGSLNIQTNAEAARQFQGMYLGENKESFRKLLIDETPFNLETFFKTIETIQFSPAFGDIPKLLLTIPKTTPTISKYEVEVEDLPF